MRIVLALVILTVAFLAGTFLVGSLLVRAVPASLPDAAMPLPYESVEFTSHSGSLIRGWYVPAPHSRGVVVLMHGVRANRLSMVGRVEFLHNAGISVLLFDFQAHGESPGSHITFGYLEAQDAQAAVQFVSQRDPGQPTFAIGVSLGGAAALLGNKPLPVNALVLEAVYPTIHAAAKNRLAIRLGSFGRLFVVPLLIQLSPRLGVSVTELRPVVGVARATAPLLIIGGDSDQHTTLADTISLYDAAASPKQLWVIPGAAHVDFHKRAGVEYESKVLEFFRRYGLASGA